MRVLTVRQPWAWAIIHGGKDVENRSRNIAGSYRGPVAIHAGQTFAPEACDAIATVTGRHVSSVIGMATIQPVGAVVGVVDLVDVHSASVIGGCGRLDHDCPKHGHCRRHCSPWAMGPAESGWFHHLVLANPRPIDPIPAKGRLGLWRPDADLEARITEALA